MKFPLVSFALLALAAGGLAVTSPSAMQVDSAAPTIRTITVTANGKTLVAPSYLAMEAKLSAHAGIAEESVRNFAQSRKRALSGLADAGIEGLDVVAGGVAFKYGQEGDDDPNNGFVVMSNSRGVDPPEPGVTCVEKLDVRFSPTGDAEQRDAQIASAMDVALELGLSLKSSTPSPYVYNPQQPGQIGGAVVGGLSAADRAHAEGATHVAAMERARGMAAHISGLAGHVIGDVVTIKLGKATETWKGIGKGFEVTSSLTVTFEML